MSFDMLWITLACAAWPQDPHDRRFKGDSSLLEDGRKERLDGCQKQPMCLQSRIPFRGGGSSSITADEIRQLFDCAFPELVFHAHRVHIQNFDPGVIQLATLLSIKTGGCPEDCGYCTQSTHADSGIKASRLMDADAVLAAAQTARDRGATRFCMGAAWRNPKDRDMGRLCEMVRGVKAMGLETCMTLGMLSEKQSEQLADAGLDFYNHNLDSSRDFYGKIITSRAYDDRLSTLARARKAGMALCCGGILGMGETRNDESAPNSS